MHKIDFKFEIFWVITPSKVRCVLLKFSALENRSRSPQLLLGLPAQKKLEYDGPNHFERFSLFDYMLLQYSYLPARTVDHHQDLSLDLFFFL